MPREEIPPHAGPAASGAYSPVVRAGDFLYVSGQGPFEPETNQLAGSSITEQVERTLRNVELHLNGAGASLEDVVKVQVYLANIADFDEFNRVYRSFFSGNLPARTTVGAQLQGILVEIDAVAYTG
jgi:2-iminobutanoate/2-iminopropanoate deaminase